MCDRTIMEFGLDAIFEWILAFVGPNWLTNMGTSHIMNMGIWLSAYLHMGAERVCALNCARPGARPGLQTSSITALGLGAQRKCGAAVGTMLFFGITQASPSLRYGDNDEAKTTFVVFPVPVDWGL